MKPRFQHMEGFSTEYTIILLSVMKIGIKLSPVNSVDAEDGLESQTFRSYDTTTTNATVADNVKVTRRYPYYTVMITLLNWIIYFYGIIFLIGWKNTTFSSDSPLSPPKESWWFMTVDWYPSCEDIRNQHWRILSLQFVHQGLMHIGGNTIAGIGFGSIFECYQPYGFFVALVIYQCGVIFGTLGHSYLWPFRGLVGCSPGVYGLIGACWSQVIANRSAFDPFPLFMLTGAVCIQMIMDIVLYLVQYSDSTGYASHAFGLYTGLCMGLMYTACIRKAVWVRMLGLLGLCGFILEAAYLNYHYLNVWPPDPYMAGYLNNKPGAMENCCAGLYHYAAMNDLSDLQDARDATYCQNDVIYEN